jgi:hypothetical protein
MPFIATLRGECDDDEAASRADNFDILIIYSL